MHELMSRECLGLQVTEHKTNRELNHSTVVYKKLFTGRHFMDGSIA